MSEPLNTGDADARDASAVRFALLTALVMIAQQVAGKATRDALFLAQFDVRELPKVMVFSAALSVVGVLAMSTLLARFGPIRLMPRGFALSAMLFLIEWWLLGYAPHAAIVMLYLHMGVVGVLLISGFWSVINERFDPHTAKRTIIRIAAAATLGGIVGGLIAGQFAAYAEPRQMLLVLAAMHGICVVGVRGIGTLGGTRRESSLPPIVAGVTTLARNHYLLQMALLMMFGALVSGLLDYALKAETSLRYAEKPDLLGFFATFYAVIGLITFAVQVGLGPWLLNRFGLGGAIFILPGAVLIGATVAAAFDHFWAYVCLRALESVFANSLFRSGFEVLYMPLAPDEKRPTKTIIDVGGNRLGDMLGGSLLLGLLALRPNIGSQWVVVTAAAVAGCSLWLMVRLYRGYVARLAGNLRSGWRPIEADDLTDATTRRIFAETTAGAERELLLGRVRQLEGRSAAIVADAIDERAVVLADLTSLQPERIRGALRSATLDVTMVPHLIPLLGQQEVADEVRTELRWLAPRVLGQLTDALLDPDVPLTARCRIPSVIEVVHSPRARDALVLGLEDAEFAVRYSCARTLVRFTRRSRELTLPEETVFSLVLRELAVDDATWRTQTHVSGGAEAVGVDEEGVLVPSLQHVFSLLSLALDGDAMQLALAGVASGEASQRGTALEYLENVLPTEVREALWERLGVTEPVERSQRSPKELLGDLLQPGRRRRP
jgi:ATP/ADP translocase